MRYTILILTVGVANALQFPSWVPFVNSYKQPQATYSIPAEAADAAGNRIAVVGAGAGGSSAAFWIGKARERFGLDVEIDVFEREDYVGGSECLIVDFVFSRFWGPILSLVTSLLTFFFRVCA